MSVTNVRDSEACEAKIPTPNKKANRKLPKLNVG